MQIDEEFKLKKLEVFLAFMRSGNLSKAAAELNTSNVSVHRAEDAVAERVHRFSACGAHSRDVTERSSIKRRGVSLR